MSARSRWAAGIVIAVLAGLAATFAANWWVLRQSRLHIVKTSAELPLLDVGLVLGTSPTLASGGTNPFFAGRIAVAAQLYRIGSVKHLLVSGDNGRRTYDEPTAMRDALIAAGVPAASITLDYAGFRTLDSMARARAVFGLQRVTVITDDFHLPRAIFLARSHGLEAFGFPSGRVPLRWSKKTRAREVLSRVKACLDVYVLHTKPKFLGPPVTLEIAR
jgi:SanA protein